MKIGFQAEIHKGGAARMSAYGIDWLTADEVAFFKTNGYLVKERVLDPVLIKRARDLCASAAKATLRCRTPNSEPAACRRLPR